MITIINQLRLLLETPEFIQEIGQVYLDVYENSIKHNTKYANPKSLIPFGRKIYSQSDEDGIIEEIFNRIGTTNQSFIEIGVGDGLENNTICLMHKGWHGLWFEGSKKKSRKIQTALNPTIKSGSLSVINAFITKENINSLISAIFPASEVDLLSIDIDGNDFYIINALQCVSPRVIVVEYNSKFPPPIEYCMKYNPSHKWDGTDNFGASLKFLEINLAKKNYLLVGCSLSGCNAFFIRQDLIQHHFLEPFTAEIHYEPPRYFLRKRNVGHPAAYSTIVNKAHK